MIVLNINSDAIVAHTARIEQIGKSALPVAVRGALNRAAFDVKTDTMPKSAKRFTQRSPTFFKSQSKVKPAQGFDIKTMQSEVGFIPASGAKESGGATEDLEQQEHGGKIGHRAFVPLKAARAGSSYNRRVSNKNRMAALRSKIKDAKKSGAATDKGKWFSSAIHAGVGGVVISNTNPRQLRRINKIMRKGGNTIIGSTAIYSVEKNRKVKIKATNFMRKASNESAAKVERYFIEEANKQIAKVK